MRFDLIATTIDFGYLEDYYSWEFAKALQEREIAKKKQTEGNDQKDEQKENEPMDEDDNNNANKNNNNNNNANDEPVKDFDDFDDLDAVQDSEQKLRKEIYSVFILAKFMDYLSKELGFSAAKILKEVVARQECGQCLECELPTCFLTSFVNQIHKTPAKAFITAHQDRLHKHVRAHLMYVFICIFVIF